MNVLTYQEIDPADIDRLCQRYGLQLEVLPEGAEIPGGYWPAPEAGLIGNRLLIRPDTPLHSLWHEGCHYICMDQQRRSQLHTDAGGEFIEENGVCYLQILLADEIQGMGRERMMADMDRWGYTFRLGSAKAWFEQDADDARQWLQEQGIIDPQERPTGRLCQDERAPDSYQPLRQWLGLEQVFPFSQHWSAAADFLTLIAQHCLDTKPRLILECGSGLTTLVLARCCQLNGVGQVISLENGEAFALQLREALKSYGLERFATVHSTPLQPIQLANEHYLWYRLEGIELPSEPMEMMVIDGPPGRLCPQARYPALPLFHDRLAPGCQLFVDDAARPDEQALVQRWLADYPDLQLEYLNNERGCARLHVRPKTD